MSSSRSHDQSEALQAVQNDAETARARDLMARAVGRDRAAFGQLVMLYQDRVYNAVLRLVGDRDEAMELTQEAFTRALASLENFRSESAPYTWLFRIAANLSITRLKTVKRRRTFSLDQTGSTNGQYGGDQATSLIDRVRQSTQGPSEIVETRERAEQVVSALGKVDPEYRAVLIMRDIEGFDYQQMADVLGLPLGTLKSKLFRARIALRDELKPYMGK